MKINRTALQTAGLYALIGISWTIFSDQILLALTPDLLVFSWIGTWKGVAFIFASACIIYLISKPRVRIENRASWNGISEPGAGSLVLVFAVLAGVILLAGFVLVAQMTAKQRDREIESLQAIADLKVSQISAWLAERDADARMIFNDDSLVNLYLEWRQSESTLARRRLEERLQTYKKSKDYIEVVLLSIDGDQFSTNPSSRNLTKLPAVQGAVKKAHTTGQLINTDLYRDEEGKLGRVHLDFVVPLRSGSMKHELTAVIRTDPNRFLFPFIQSWPIPSATAETLLFRREGNNVLFLNELRHRSDTSVRLRVPVDEKNLLASQVLRGDALPDQAVEGVDYRDIAVLGVVKAIPGTPWFLVAKLDKGELYSGAKRDAGWIALADILALIVAAVATIFIRQRDELRHAAIQRQDQVEKLQALQLLEAIAEGSNDAIFAKDSNGRYLLLNRELCRFLGKSRQELLGRDDCEVFPAEDAQRIRSDDQKAMRSGLIECAEESLPTTGGRRTFLTTRGPVRDQDGKVIGVFGIARDVTERNFQEREIRAGESRFRAIFDGVNDGIVLHDIANGVILEGNVRVAEMFGYGRQEIRQLTIADLSSDTTPFTRDVLSKWLERANQGESPIFEWMARHKDGHLFNVQISMRMAEVSGRSCVIVLIRKLRDRDEINQIDLLPEISPAVL